MQNLTEFLHLLRADIIARTGKSNLLLRFQVEETTKPGTLVLEAVFIGETIVPFVWDDGDFADLERSRKFILENLPKTISRPKVEGEEGKRE